MLPSSPGELRFKRDTATLRAAERANEPAQRWSHARAFLATREAMNSLFPETACVPPRLPEPPTVRVLLHTSTQEKHTPSFRERLAMRRRRVEQLLVWQNRT